MLYGWGLENLASLKAESQKSNMESLGFFSRDAQLVRPIMTVTELLCDEKVKKNVADWLKENFSLHHEAEEFGDNYQIANALHELYVNENGAEIRVVVRDVAEKWLAGLGIERHFEDGKLNNRFNGALNAKSREVSFFIKGNVPGTKKPTLSGGVTIYRLQRRALLRLFAKYHLWKDAEAQDNLSSTTPTTSTSSTTSTTSTKNEDSTNRTDSQSVEQVEQVERGKRVEVSP